MSLADFSRKADSLSIEQLRGRATRKWSMRMGESLLDGAWIAEADFGTAPQVEAALHEAIWATCLPG